MQREADRLVDQVLDGTYRLGARIGVGGMGAVYVARHLGTDRPVAIKVLLPEVVGNPRAVERFRREARAAGRLRHPNVVDVTDFGVAQVDGHEVAYLVMEFLEGETLRSVLDARGALPLDVAVEVVEQVASALDAAHAAGIVHRDLKPDNVWLVPDARGGYAVRVLDFGIALLGQLDAPVEATAHADATAHGGWTPGARAHIESTAVIDLDAVTPVAIDTGAHDATTAERLSHGDVEDTTGRLTHVGTLVGTPSYMSPEQWQGAETTAASDTYSLGVLAWEMLAGQRPFLGSLAELAAAHQHRPVPALEAHAPAVSAVIARAMAKAPAARYAGSGAFAGSLRVAAESAGVVLRRAVALYANRWPEMRRVAWHCARWPVAISVLAALLLGSAALAGLGTSKGLVVTAALVGGYGWIAVTLATNAFFALAIDRLRTRPFENLDPDALAIDLRNRLGLPPQARRLHTLSRLVVFYTRCELSAKEGTTGDLAFLVGLLEGVPLADIKARTAALVVGVKRAYLIFMVGVFASMLVLPVCEAAVVVLAWMQFGEPSLKVAASVGMLLAPVNVMLVNPVLSSALALLYFRGRQALGEDVGLGGVLQGRL